MQQDTASFWSEIKTLDARLAENPASLCFAKLADVYLKVGLVDDALHLARQGVQRYPRYLAGQRALALACHAKGILDECRQALEELTAAMPEDAASQKMLARLYLQAGNTSAAVFCFQTLLDFYPDDNESRIELNSIQPSASAAAGFSTAAQAEEELVEELDEADILEIDELDLIEDEEQELQESCGEEQQPVVLRSEPPPAAAREHHDPLSTVTLAELYVKQGFIEKALIIYRALLADNPENQEVLARVRQLEPDHAVVAPEAADLPESGSIPESFEQPEPAETFVLPSMAAEPAADALNAPASGSADNRIATLSTWLENIRRIKSCR